MNLNDCSADWAQLIDKGMVTAVDEKQVQQSRQALTFRVIAGTAFTIKTPPSADLLRNLREWLLSGALGAIVFARTRTGKTSAIKWVLDALSEVFGGPVSYLRVSHRSSGENYTGPFFHQLLEAANHEYVKRGTVPERRTRLTNYLVSKARASIINTCVIVIDEAQKLTENELVLLLEICNEVELGGCRVFALLIGQMELQDKGTKFIETGQQEQLYERFFANQLHLQCLGTVEEIQSCLVELDNTKFPPGEPVFFVETYLTVAWQRGFRLSSLAPKIFECFQQVANSVSGGVAFQLPMGYLMRTIVRLLNSLADSGHTSLIVDDLLIMQAVKACKYEASVKARVSREGTAKMPVV